jgi:hypothetical protein
MGKVSFLGFSRLRQGFRVSSLLNFLDLELEFSADHELARPNDCSGVESFNSLNTERLTLSKLET